MKDSIHYLYDFERNSVILSLSDEFIFSNNDNFLISFEKANNL
jgi:ADP-dependent phosphofructokinase/glucokinase